MSRRSFLALGASGLSLGALGPIRAPAETPLSAPPEWALAERALAGRLLGRIDYAHIAFDPARPADLWAILSLLQDYAEWPWPSKVSILSGALQSAPFIASIEIRGGVRLTIDGRDRDRRQSALSGTRATLDLDRASGIFRANGRGETWPVPWKTAHPIRPDAAATEWAARVCDALRESARVGRA